MKPMQWITGKLLVVGLLASSVLSAASAPDARDLLAKMADSAQSLNYHGEFIYQQGGQLETLSVIHQAGAQGQSESERIVYLDGVPREVIRTGDEMFLSQHGGRVTRFQHGSLMPVVDRFQMGVPDDYYDLKLLGIDRIAGREAFLLLVMPKDRFRYGYQLWLDRESSLLLRSELVNSQGKIIERLQFTSLDVGQLPDDARELVEQRPAAVDASIVVSSQPDEAARVEPQWKAGWLPEGFVQQNSAVRSSPVSKQTVDALTFSDGIASFTVFVEPDETGVLNQASEKIGALSAVAKVYREGNNYFHITVVGDIPLGTAERVAISVRPAS